MAFADIISRMHASALEKFSLQVCHLKLSGYMLPKQRNMSFDGKSKIELFSSLIRKLYETTKNNQVHIDQIKKKCHVR